MGTAYFVRHIETEANEKGLFGGGVLDFATKRGRAQGIALGKRLVEDGIKFSRVLRGTAVRHLTTFELIESEYPEETLPITINHWLNEQGVGEWEGKSKVELDPQTLADWRAGKILPPGGESDDEFEKRVKSFLEVFVLPSLRQQDENLLIITSGNPIRRIVGHILGVRWRNLLPALICDNASLTVVKVSRDGKCFVGPINDTYHLKNIGVAPIPGT